MIALLLLLFILISFIKPESKRISVILLLLLIVDISITNTNVDYIIYQNRYDDPTGIEGYTEPLFTLIELFFKNINVDFHFFRIIVLSIYVIVLYILIKQKTKYTSIVIGLFSILPFCLHMSWIRFSLAFLLVYCYFIIYSKYKKLSILLLLLAIFIHSGTIICLPFILIERVKSSNKMICYILIITCLAFFFVNVSNSMNIVAFIIGDGKSAVLQKAYSMGDITNSTIYRQLSVFIYVFTSVIMLFLVKKNLEGRSNYDKLPFVFFIYKINIYCLALIPLISIVDDFYRLTLYVLPLNFICFTFYKGLNKKIFNTLFIFYFVIIFYVFIGRLDVYDNAFIQFYNFQILI